MTRKKQPPAPVVMLDRDHPIVMLFERIDSSTRVTFWLQVALLAIVLAILLLGCGASPRPLTSFQRVDEQAKARAWPERRRLLEPAAPPPLPSCSVGFFPIAPNVPDMSGYVRPSELVSGIERYYLTVRQIEDVLEWSREWREHDRQVAEWGQSVIDCLNKMTR